MALADSVSRPRLLVWIPQTEDQTAAALKVIDRYPALRFVWAVSPRFFKTGKNSALKKDLQELEKTGRISVALQIPNAPFLPLLANTDEAKTAVPADTSLPTPPYLGTDDVIQHVARAKSEFIKNWGTSPKGLVLPYGAFSPALLKVLQGQGFDWIVAAWGSGESAGGLYQTEGFLGWKSLMLWDGAQPQSPTAAVNILVWDEREQKGVGAIKTLDAWGKSLEHDRATALLPADSMLPTPQKLTDDLIHKRTWTQSDWSSWIGVPEKNAIWSALKKTHDAMEAYQNSGQASISRLDAAMEEFLTAENGNFVLFAGSATLSDIEREDRMRDMDALFGTIYRLIGQTPPDDLLQSASSPDSTTPAALQPLATGDILPDGRERFRLADALLHMEVIASSDTLTWMVGTSSAVVNATFDIYVDINGLANVGITSLLPGRGLSVRPEDAWEYALSFSGTQATLYRTQGANTFVAAGNFPISGDVHALTVPVPRQEMRGNVRRWGYRVLILDKELHALHAMERKQR